MKLTYIEHSGFAIRTEGITIILDYFKDSSSDKDKGIVYSELLKNGDKIYNLSSHSHFDHYNSEVLTWKDIHHNIVYVFSKEIKDTLHLNNNNEVNYLDKLETYEDDKVKIKAFGSTDIGGSFLIEIENKLIFHAGDLNNWHWNEESTKEEIEEAENYYMTELNLLASEVKHLDLAMFPIDPSLGKDFMKGAEQFLTKIPTDILVPMHFRNRYEKIVEFTSFAQAVSCEYICWTHPNQSIYF